MDWKALGQKVGKAAPLLGSALGGPAGGAVGAIIASAFGADSTPDAVAAAIKSSPDAVIKLKEIEAQNEQSLRDYQFKVLDIELKDIQNARAANSHNPMPAIICCSLTVLVGLGAYALFKFNIPEENSEIAYLLFGTLLAKWGDSIAYWIGTTRSSAEKDRRLAK